MGPSLVYLPLNLIIQNVTIVILYINKAKTTRIGTSVRYPLIIIITRNTKFYNYYSNSTVRQYITDTLQQ